MVNLGHLVVRWGIASAGIFYRVERTGPALPAGPVLLVANHHNMLLDPLLALAAAGRRVRVLAKAPLFDIPVFGRILRSVDTLPLYRVQDDRDQTHRNRLAFEESVAEFGAGGTLLTFPEGKSHSDPALAPLKSGAARVALAAEQGSGWRLGVQIVPVGLTYARRQSFRSSVVAAVGTPIRVADWRPAYRSNPNRAAAELTRAIAEGLRRVTLNLEDASQRPLIEVADLIWSREHRSLHWRARERLAERLPRRQRLAAQFAWLKAQGGERWPRLAQALGSYARRLQRLGGGEIDAPNAAEMETATSEVRRDAAVLAATVPVVALGTAAWLVPCLVAGLICRLMRPPIETIATVKLLTALVATPLYYLAVVAAAYGAAGPWLGAAVALALPALALAALAAGRRLGELWQDVRLLSAVRRRPKLRDRLAGRRRALAVELDALAAAWARGRSASLAG